MAFVTGWASLRLWRSFKLIYLHYSCLKYSYIYTYRYIRAHIILESTNWKKEKVSQIIETVSRIAISNLIAFCLAMRFRRKEANFIVLAKHFLQSLNSFSTQFQKSFFRLPILYPDSLHNSFPNRKMYSLSFSCHKLIIFFTFIKCAKIELVHFIFAQNRYYEYVRVHEY